MTPARHEQSPAGAAADMANRVSRAIPRLVSDRVRLRPPEVRDFDLYADIVCGQRGAHIGGPMSRSDAWMDFIQMASGWVLHGHGGWAIALNGSDRALGFVILGLEPGDQEPELGYLLAAEAEGRGIAYEASALARRFAQEELGLPGLVSYVDPDNTRSCRLAERLGARRDSAAEAKIGEPVHVYRHPMDRRLT